MFPKITSLQNPRIKDAVRLRQRRGRAKQGRFVIDGLREVQRAVAAGVPLTDVFLCGSPVDDHVLALAESLAAEGVEVSQLAPNVFEKLAYGDRNEQLIAVARTPRTSLEQLSVSGDGPVIVLESVEKPGNVGAVLRTADAAAASAVIVADGGTDLYNPNAIRASLGAIFSVPVCAASSRDALDWLLAGQFPIFAARLGENVCYTTASLGRRCAIVLGSEACGLSDIWRGPGITGISLPMLGTVDSLNVSNTAAILLYEAWRQRTAS
jgi:TrmH family RNA methyltransferase